MKNTLVIGLVLASAWLGLVTGTGRAETAELQLTIEGLGCTLDTTYSQLQPNVSLQPADCNDATIVERIEAQQISLPPETQANLAPPDENPGDQAIFEDTPLETVAAWSGVGNSTASAVRPVLATGFLVATTITIIDMLFLELRFTQAAVNFAKVGLTSLARVVTRGF